jgi:hypothetical protein
VSAGSQKKEQINFVDEGRDHMLCSNIPPPTVHEVTGSIPSIFVGKNISCTVFRIQIFPTRILNTRSKRQRNPDRIRNKELVVLLTQKIFKLSS